MSTSTLAKAIVPKHCIVCYGFPLDEEWKETVSEDLDPIQFEYHFLPDGPGMLYIFWLGLKFIWLVKRTQANVIVTYNPRQSFWFSLFLLLSGASVKHIAYAFNFYDLPQGKKRQVQAWVYKLVHHFVVHSNLEKELYSKHFNIPTNRIDVQLWWMREPKFEPLEPLKTGDYICALGTNARDYASLLAAMKQLPNIKLVVVARPNNFENLELPPNVDISLNIEMPQAMNILNFSRFMVLPLINSEERCGHVTLVAAMLLGKAFIATEAIGIQDYIRSGYNSITCAPASPNDLAQKIHHLWSDPFHCQQLGENGKQFAKSNFSSTAGRSKFQQLIAQVCSKP
ncbi:MAG: glycosyltransferase family 4 protein [Kovacikia sp.]